MTVSGGSAGPVIGHAVVDGTALVSINRAEKANALRARDKRELAAAIESLGGDPDVRAIVVAGQGGRAFCAGTDIEEMRHFGVSEMHAMLGDERAMYASVLESPKPVIAAVNGFALGTGLVLAMVADYSIAATTAQLGTPELTIGVAVPLHGLLLPYLVGLNRARELLYTGERVSGEQAHRIGLVTAVAPADQVLERATAVAQRIGSLPADGFRVEKQLVNRLLTTGDLDRVIVESRYATSLQFGEDATGRAMAEFLGRSGPR